MPEGNPEAYTRPAADPGMKDTKQATPGPDRQMGGKRQAAPEEQRKYEVVVMNALTYLHGDGRDEVLRQIQAAKDPIMGIGRAAAFIETALIQSARDAGKELPIPVMLHAQKEIVGDLVKLSAAEGLVKETPETQVRAYYEASEQLRRRLEAMGAASPEEKQQAQAQYQQVLQMGSRGGQPSGRGGRPSGGGGLVEQAAGGQR